MKQEEIDELTDWLIDRKECVKDTEETDLTVVYLKGYADAEEKCRDKIKKLEEENRLQRSQLNSAFNNGFIPKQKVKDKIEELKLSGGNNGKDNVENLVRELAIEILEELLEDE